MITNYFDSGCYELKESQDLKLMNDYSALWFWSEGNNLNNLLSCMLDAFNPYIGCFWLASKGGSESTKILDIKRVFSSWGIPRKQLLFTSEICDQNGVKYYSDVAKICSAKINEFSELVRRNLFGIDSSIFFLSEGVNLECNRNITSGLTELLIKRNNALEINESLKNSRLLEAYIKNVVELNGFATVTLRDSNMSTIIVVIGNEFSLRKIFQEKIKNPRVKDKITVASKAEFLRLINLGVSVSVLG